MNTHKSYPFKTLVAIVLMIVTFGAFKALALPVSHYASSSVLSTGKWAKIKVKSSGMQFISNAQLASLGFTDPTKVNVYGFGGRVISELLDTIQPDDLPLLPSIKTSSGIVFFGVDHILWTAKATGWGGRIMSYSHTMQPYAEESYYFVSDIPTENINIPTVDLTDTSDLETIDCFIERQVYEQDLYAPSVTGRNLLGEDLRGNGKQLAFNLPGNKGGYAKLNITIGSKIAAKSNLSLSSTNSTLSNPTILIGGSSNNETFMTVTRTDIPILAEDCGETIDLTLKMPAASVTGFIRLDWVELEYERDLHLNGDQLYFYFNERQDLEAVLKGISGETEVWEVTAGHAPKKVIFRTSGSEARFLVEAGYHEFIAFNPSKVNKPVEAAGTVGPQNIHGMESPDLLIISPSEYMEAARKIADMHRSLDKMTVHVLTPEEIYNEFSSGTPDVSAFRKVMKMWYDRDMAQGEQKLKYCLIYSRPTYDNKMITAAVKNAGYPRVPIWQSPTGYNESTSYSTDDFIGMLEDSEKGFTIDSGKINVAVGRFPVRSVEEANAAADKLIAYVNDPGRGAWRNNVLIIGDDGNNGDHVKQSNGMYDNMIVSEKGRDYQYERLFLDNFDQKNTSVGVEYPDAKKRLFSKIEEGQALITYIGHANTVSWTHEHLLNWKDITSFTNTRMPVLYAATCEFARWDADEYSGAEVLWAYPKAGMIAVICPSRSVTIAGNGPLSKHFGNYALKRNEDGSASRLGDAYLNTKNALGSQSNKLKYVMIGDPAMKLPVYAYDVAATKIYGVDVTGDDIELPVIEARSNPVVEGIVTDHQGNLAEDFSGYVYLKLYDGEKVIATKGNIDRENPGPEVVEYNDRPTKLYEGVTRVKNGKWEIEIKMPSEIENIYMPGRLTFYALADDGREANGASERFIVYGFDENAPEDNEGPEIIKFVLNHDNFKDGDVTYKTPVVYAVFSDESGINMSDTGIGHNLILTLDGRTIYSDLMNFYSPDLEDNTKGSLTYQLPELEAGKHDLTLSVWDCANNSSYATLNFNVAAIKTPDIYEIGTEIHADRNGVEFIIASDRPMAALSCELEVFDFNGIRMWHAASDDRTGVDSTLRFNWDYTTSAGRRVAKGIYLCRVIVTTPEGKSASKAKKIVVSN